MSQSLRASSAFRSPFALSLFCPLQELFRLYSGIDTDSSQYVTASAHRVGLEMPKEKS